MEVRYLSLGPMTEAERLHGVALAKEIFGDPKF